MSIDEPKVEQKPKKEKNVKGNAKPNTPKSQPNQNVDSQKGKRKR